MCVWNLCRKSHLVRAHCQTEGTEGPELTGEETSWCLFLYFSSVVFSCFVVSNSLRSQESQHTSSPHPRRSITNSRSLLKPRSIELVMPSSQLILCRPLLLLPPVPPRVRGLSNESTLRMRWQKYWHFSFSISPFNTQD